MKSLLVISALTTVLLLPAGYALAQDEDQIQDQTQDRDRTMDGDQDPDQDRDRLQTQDQDQIYGSQLMTQEERAEYRDRLRAAQDDAEREQIRQEHHERMRARAKARGVTLPKEPPANRGHKMQPGGMAPGGGMGGGMGR